jgi:colicin import membrane protein
LLANVVESSGNIAFDRSVEAAVRKADPLPMPRSQRLAALFRDLIFEFVPGN